MVGFDDWGCAMKSLGEFIALLEGRGELKRVKATVEADQEIAAITDRVCKAPGGGPALLFESLRGYRHPVATNLYGSLRRSAWALGAEDFSSLADRFALDLGEPCGGSAEERLRELLRREEWRPRLVEKASCREIVERDGADLLSLPALKAWPGDGGRFLTLPLVFTRHPESGEVNCGMYRVQLFSRTTAGVHWGPASDGARHAGAWRERGEPMPVAIALGGEPALTYAATAPLPPGVEEVAFAGYLAGRPVEMTPSLTGGLQVPAGAEFILEGTVSPGETALEGPFGNHTGFYSPPEEVPLFRLELLSRRREAIFPCTVVGPPPMEDCYLAKATERLFLPLLRLQFPELVDINFPLEGIFHGCALASIRGAGPGRGHRALESLRATSLFRRSRLLIVFDQEVDVQDLSGSFWRALNRVDPLRDLFPSAEGLGIDATDREGRAAVGVDPAVLARVARRWGEYGLPG